MHLVSITDPHQQAFLTVQAALRNSSLWIGLSSHDVSFKSQWPGLGDGMWHFFIAHSISHNRLKRPRDHKVLLQWMNFVKYVIFSGSHFSTDLLLYCLALEKCPMDICSWALLFIYSNQRWSWNRAAISPQPMKRRGEGQLQNHRGLGEWKLMDIIKGLFIPFWISNVKLSHSKKELEEQFTASPTLVLGAYWPLSPTTNASLLLIPDTELHTYSTNRNIYAPKSFGQN